MLELVNKGPCLPDFFLWKTCHLVVDISWWVMQLRCLFWLRDHKYLCYSPTCTPAQLSLLSEAIAKYSAFLERGEKKQGQVIKKKKKILWQNEMGWKNAKLKHHFYGCMTGLCFVTYRREVLVLVLVLVFTTEEDDKTETWQVGTGSVTKRHKWKHTNTMETLITLKVSTQGDWRNGRVFNQREDVTKHRVKL